MLTDSIAIFRIVFIPIFGDNVCVTLYLYSFNSLQVVSREEAAQEPEARKKYSAD